MEYHNAHSFVSSFSSYVFDIVAVPQTTLYAASASNHKIKLYDQSSFQLTAELSGHTDTIQQIFINENCPSLIFSCSSDSSVRCWDTRLNAQSQIYTRDEKFEFFSVSVGGRDYNTIVASSEAAISFWDRREGYYYKQYTESHSSDITQVQFHPENPSTLYSASQDGLVSIFDITKKNEDDAYLDTLSVDHSISKIGFALPLDYFFAITNDERLSLWSISTGNLEKDFGDVRELFGETLKLDYMINCFYHPDYKQLILFGGSNEGDLHLFDISASQFQHICTLPSGHVDVIRTFHWNTNTNQIITGGEDARVCCWNHGPGPVIQPSTEITVNENIIPSEQREKRHENMRKAASPY